MEFLVYPGFNAYYYGYYLRGLLDLGPEVALRYTRSRFPRFGHHCLALVHVESGKRLFVSASDGPVVNQQALEWCNVYAKANLDLGSVPGHLGERCMPIGPSFGIRQWSWGAALALAGANGLRMGTWLERPREHLANYYRQRRYRLPMSAYCPQDSSPTDIFFAATAWRKESATNRYRASFIEVCRDLPQVRFEGGFAPREDLPELRSLMLDRRYTLGEYLERLQRSAVVFNTPVVSSCHGWKLAEYLALGKAIITTPLSRELPAPLRHGEEIHTVSGSPKSIRDAVERLVDDTGYRLRLEQGARAYFDLYLSPRRVMERILTAATLR